MVQVQIGFSARLFGLAPALLLTPIALVAAAPAAEIHVPRDFPTIQQAIDAAADGDDILIAPGTYNELLDLLGKALTLRGEAGAEETIISAAGLDGRAITFADAEGNEATIEGLTITGGDDTGIYIRESSLHVSACLLVQNKVHVHLQGGEVTIEGTSFDTANGPAVRSMFGSVRLVDSIFRNHDAGVVVDLFGGGPYEILSCTFERNSTRVLLFQNTIATVTGCRFVRNSAPSSTIILVWETAADFTDCDFLANWTEPGTAQTDGGGAVAYGKKSSGVVRQCRFRNNSGEYCSAIIVSDSDVTVDGCELATNRSTFPGSAAIRGHTSSLIVKDSTFCQNSPTNIAVPEYTDGGGNTFATTCCGLVGPDVIDVPRESSLDAAFALMVCGEIRLAPGVHAGGIELGANPIHLRGTGGSAATILDAGGLERSAVTIAGPFAGDVTLEGLTITGGNAPEGGGLRIDAAAAPTLLDCHIAGNSATLGGGIFFNSSDGGVLTGNDVIITGNTAARGGGLYVNEDASVVIDNLEVSGNIATGGTGGGGLHLGPGAAAAVLNVRFGGNAAPRGAAVTQSPSTSATYSNCQFIDNAATLSGGAMFLGGAAAIDRCLFQENSAGEQGGAVHALSFAAVTISDSTFCGNVPDHLDGPWSDGGGNAFAAACGTRADLNGDGAVDAQDLLLLLGAWGDCSEPCPADLDGNGAVNVQDMLILLQNWG